MYVSFCHTSLNKKEEGHLVIIISYTHTLPYIHTQHEDENITWSVTRDSKSETTNDSNDHKVQKWEKETQRYLGGGGTGRGGGAERRRVGGGRRQTQRKRESKRWVWEVVEGRKTATQTERQEERQRNRQRDRERDRDIDRESYTTYDYMTYDNIGL